MENFKQKLVDNLDDDKVFYFNYILYGKYGLITSKQFIKKCLLLDLLIIFIFLVYNFFI